MKDTLNDKNRGMRSHRFHKLWLKVAAVVIGISAPIFFFGTMESTTEPARLTLDILSWPVDGQTTYDSKDVRFLSALTGGFLLGWGMTVWFLSIWVYDLAPEGVRKTVLIGLLSWFCLDSAGSVLSGNPSNVFFNLIILFTAVGPLWLPVETSTKK